jgi:hypothetical protein
MFKKFFDFSISAILLTIGLGLYLTGLVIFGLSSVRVFCFFSCFVCAGMSAYLIFTTPNDCFRQTCILMLIFLSAILFVMGAMYRI